MQPVLLAAACSARAKLCQANPLVRTRPLPSLTQQSRPRHPAERVPADGWAGSTHASAGRIGEVDGVQLRKLMAACAVSLHRPPPRRHGCRQLLRTASAAGSEDCPGCRQIRELLLAYRSLAMGCADRPSSEAVERPPDGARPVHRPCKHPGGHIRARVARGDTAATPRNCVPAKSSC